MQKTFENWMRVSGSKLDVSTARLKKMALIISDNMQFNYYTSDALDEFLTITRVLFARMAQGVKLYSPLHQDCNCKICLYFLSKRI